MIKGIRGFEIMSRIEGDHTPLTYNDGVLTAISGGTKVYYGHPMVRTGATSNILGLPAVTSDIVTAAAILGFSMGDSEAATTNRLGVGFATRPREYRPSTGGGTAENVEIFLADANSTVVVMCFHADVLTAINASTPPTTPAAMRAKLLALIGTTYGLKSDVAGGTVFAATDTGAGIVKYFTLDGFVDSDIADPSLYTASGISTSAQVRGRFTIVSTLSQYNTPSASSTLQTTNRTDPSNVTIHYPIVV